jgi:flagellar hook-basal body complex protein FliE
MSLARIEALPLTATGVVPANEAAPLGRAGEASGPASFEALLGGAIDQVNSLNAVAEQKTQALAAGAIDDIHGTMISVKEADIAIKLVGTVRNKILDAFQELWRTSV